MEKITNNPGLKHLAEKIFWDLNPSDLQKCQSINQSASQIASQILENPMFLIKKLIQNGLSKKNQNDWIEAIQLEMNSEKKKAIVAYLNWKLKNENSFDFPCYTNPDVQKIHRSKILEICHFGKSSNDTEKEIVKILAPWTNHAISDYAKHDIFFNSPIYMAVIRGCKELVKILAPLTENLNSLKINGNTLIFSATWLGHTEVVKILASFMDNPNAPNIDGMTPISWAAKTGQTEIVKFLAPLTANSNSPMKDGTTPIYWAAKNGHIKIVKI